MEPQSTNTRAKTNTEPGRRYSAGRLVARPGNDIISRPARTPIVPTDSSKPTRQNRTVAKTKPALPRTKRSLVLKRQMVERAEEYKIHKKEAKKKHYYWYLVALVIFLAFGIVAWSFRGLLPFDFSLFSKQKPAASLSENKVQEVSSTLDETESTPAQVQANQVAKDAPKVLRIPSIALEAKIRQVGSTLQNEPIAPSNIFDIGWYDASGKPGEPGAVLLNGHTKGPTKEGIFSQLNQLNEGDQILLERGDGQVITYVVAKLQEYSGGQIDMIAATNPIDPTKQGLNLVTTVTKYSHTQNRLIVFALRQ